MKIKRLHKQISIRPVIFLLGLLFLVLGNATFVKAYETRSEIGDAALSSDIPHIPEPMFFDLVRPLGVRQGDLEINTLSGHSFRTGQTEWAPEIEFGLFDNFAVEIEMPFHQLSLIDYKLAVQGTFDTKFNHRFIHGFQLIGYHDRKNQKYTIDGLYLAGFRLNSAISNFNMMGLRRENVERDGDFVGLFNSSWFYDYSQKLTIGIEMNNEFSQKSGWHYLLIPQIHWDFNDHVTLQAGTGLSQRNGRQTDWIGSWRIVYAF